MRQNLIIRTSATSALVLSTILCGMGAEPSSSEPAVMALLRARFDAIVTEEVDFEASEMLPDGGHKEFAQGTWAACWASERTHCTYKAAGDAKAITVINTKDRSMRWVRGATKPGYVEKHWGVDTTLLTQCYPSMVLDRLGPESWRTALARREFEVVEAETKFGGHRVCIVQAWICQYPEYPDHPGHKALAYVDLDRGAVPLRVEIWYFGKTLHDLWSYTVLAAEEVAPGLWVPTVSEFDSGLRVKFSRLAFNQGIDEALFDPQLPERTTVFDLVTGQKYLIGQGSSDPVVRMAREMAEEVTGAKPPFPDVRSGHDLAAPTGEDSGQPTGRSFPLAWVIVAGILAITVGGAGYLYLSRRRSQVK